MNTIMIQIDYQNCLALVRFDRGVTNPINAQMVADLSHALEDLESNPNVKGVILVGADEKFFSIGFDIPGLYDLPL